MSPSRIGVLVGLDLKQRIRRPGFYVLLAIFFVVVTAITWLASLAFAGSGGLGNAMYSVAVYGVLLMATLVTPTFTGNAVNGDRDQATLAPVQVTLATTGEILAAKVLAGWATGLVYLVAALPALVYALIRGSIAPPMPYAEHTMRSGMEGVLHPGALAVSLVVLVVEIGVIAAIGVGLSAVIARPLFSVAATYLVVMLLTVGTLIGFGLGTLASQSSTSTLTESPRELEGWANIDGEIVPGDAPPSCDDAAPGERCQVPRPDVTERCVEVRNTGTAPRPDRVWWLLAANPFVVLADATPTAYNEFDTPVDAFGNIKLFVRGAQQSPDLVHDDWNDPCDGRAATPGGYYADDHMTGRETIESSVPSWFVGLGIQVLLAGGLLAWGASRTRTPAVRTPPGSRIA